MKSFSYPVLAVLLALFLVTSACEPLRGSSPTPVGIILTEDQTPGPTSTGTASVTATETSVTPLIPITGENVVSMQCQFCVNEETHAVLIFPEFAYFDVVSPSPVTCFTAEVVNGSRILICRGAQSATFSLNICSDSANCLEFPVTFQECPLVQDGTPFATFTPFAPFFLTPINTLLPPTEPDTTAVPSTTPTPGSVPVTPTPPVPAATQTPPAPAPTATQPPPPEPTDTAPPPPTVQPTDPTGVSGEAQPAFSLALSVTFLMKTQTSGKR